MWHYTGEWKCLRMWFFKISTVSLVHTYQWLTQKVEGLFCFCPWYYVFVYHLLRLQENAGIYATFQKFHGACLTSTKTVLPHQQKKLKPPHPFKNSWVCHCYTNTRHFWFYCKSVMSKFVIEFISWYSNTSYDISEIKNKISIKCWFIGWFLCIYLELMHAAEVVWLT